MAASTRIHTLALGMQTVRLAEFHTGSNGGLILAAYEESGLLPDPAGDATRAGQIKIAVSELREKLSVRRALVNYAISAQSVFTRFVKLPSVGEEKVEQIITFEAQQNVPFPINEVVWDYQLVGAEQGGKMEVVLVAIKSDLLNELNEAVEDAGLRTGIVDVAPMALYNAFRYNYSDTSECSLLIDIGARTTNLLFIEPGKVFSRSIPIGGSTITQSIAKDFGEPIMAAEERKKRDAYVSLGGTYAEHSDPDVARVSKMVRGTLTRLHAEINRSISFYRAQQQGSQPARAFLCGGSSGMPYTREFFSEKLRMPVEFFNALRNVAVTSQMDSERASRSAHLLGEAVGLALRSTSDCPMELNLRPATVAKQQELSQRRSFLVLAAVCLLLALAGWWVYYLQAGRVEGDVLGDLEPKVAELKRYENRFREIDRSVRQQQEIAAPYLTAVRQRDYWVQLIDDLNARLPERHVWITVMEPGYFTEEGNFTSIAPGKEGPRRAARPTKPGEAAKAAPAPGLHIEGLYLWNDRPTPQTVVDDFLRALGESSFFEIDQNQRNWVMPIRQTPTDTEWAYPFELRLKLKNPPFAE